MAGKDFLEEQRRRQRDLVAARAARQNPEAVAVAPKEEQAPKTFGERMQNFWFYNKFFVLAAIFLAVVLAIGIKQCAGREKFDTEVVLYTYHTYTPDQINAIEEELEKYGEDINGDGEVNYQIIDCAYDKTTIFDQRNAKGGKLTANITSNDKAIMYITDAETFAQLQERYASEDIEFFVDIGLPNDDGRSLILSQEFHNSVNAKSTAGLKLPEGLRISRRIAGKDITIGTAEKQTASADRVLERMAKNIKNEAE